MENNIKIIRKEKGISQTDLADALKISVYYLNRIENGKVKVPFILAARIANVLECRLEDIFLH